MVFLGKRIGWVATSYGRITGQVGARFLFAASQPRKSYGRHISPTNRRQNETVDTMVQRHQTHHNFLRIGHAVN